MNGTIVYINHRRGMIAIQLENDSYTVSEHIDSCNLEVGQRVRGPLGSPGCEYLYNIDEQERFEVCNEWCEISENQAKRALAQFL
ncbi:MULTISPECIES: hypothetical protein [Vibrio]|uniref:hypothetical protein n=1 Tax=Vibrio TaxID=662 RepID=UPI00063DA913|nr:MULTISPECIES: hypothetical protein [Vibrio]HDY7442747.1 hypothetical protein [Vibrio vulnificus]KLI65994.1 hypothetical protein VVYB158_18545 [Vibrio vulnificus CladeA-yb158]MBJ6893173.1 hypothetical protein [Vibrio cholerae]MBJ6896838.1 hypothetical protein [Vibrio cholerae]MBJ6901600.1 hypothetical protein [Vibrio cholerae]